jgi:sugar lactone lactonase YvrE
MASDGAGNLFVADSGNTIRRVVIATGAVTTLAGSAGSQGSADGTGAAARFNSVLLAVASDGAGNLFVADQETIRKVVIATGAVTTLAGSAGNVGSADGTGTAARFFDPDGVASDGAGNLFVADLGNSTIRKVVIATGVVTTVVGSPSRDGFILGPLPAGLYQPSGLAFGPTGELFITGPNTVLVAQF